jgi:hypothetical protein
MPYPPQLATSSRTLLNHRIVTLAAACPDPRPLPVGVYDMHGYAYHTAATGFST